MSKYRAKVLFEIASWEDEKNEIGSTSTRFRTYVKLPFVPTKDTVLYRKGNVIDIGPFEKVVYDMEDKSFICTMKPWKPSEDSKNLYDEVQRVIYNLEKDGWYQA